MGSVAEAMMSFVVSLAAASYGHFGVTLKAAPPLHHPHTQRQQTVQRLPASAVTALPPCLETIAQRPAPANIRHA